MQGTGAPAAAPGVREHPPGDADQPAELRAARDVLLPAPRDRVRLADRVVGVVPRRHGARVREHAGVGRSVEVFEVHEVQVSARSPIATGGATMCGRSGAGAAEEVGQDRPRRRPGPRPAAHARRPGRCAPRRAGSAARARSACAAGNTRSCSPQTTSTGCVELRQPAVDRAPAGRRRRRRRPPDRADRVVGAGPRQRGVVLARRRRRARAAGRRRTARAAPASRAVAGRRVEQPHELGADLVAEAGAVDQHEPRDALRRCQRGAHGHRAAERVPDERRALQAERPSQQLDDRGGEAGGAVAAQSRLGHVALAVRREVDRRPRGDRSRAARARPATSPTSRRCRAAARPAERRPGRPRARRRAVLGRASIRSSRGSSAPSPAAARSTSSLVMRPPGPVAVTVARSMPSSRARLRAAGEAVTRPPASRSAGPRRPRTTRVRAAGAGRRRRRSPCWRRTNASTSSSLSVSPGRGDHGDRAGHGHLAAGLGDDPPQHAVARRLDVVDRLVGLDREQRIAGRDRVALGPQPLGDGARPSSACPTWASSRATACAVAARR